jgi:serine/threonine-protein kinase
VSGRQPDERSDVFSLGAVLYHLLTGVPPTTTTSDERIPEGLQPAIDRALYPLPSGRFRTVAEFAAAIAGTQNAPAVESPTARVEASRAVEYRSAAALVAVAAGLWLLGSLRPPTAAPPVLTASRESASVPAAETQPRPPTPPRPVAASPAPSSGRRSTTAARPDADSGPRISPFRRAHPWVAVPGQRFYYRSSCPVALQSRDLLYFTNEDEARAAGYVPSDIPECR